MTRPLVPGYQLGDLIATGSTATVWAATPVDGAADLAVKVVPVGGEAADHLSFELSALTATRASEHLIAVRDVVAVESPEPAVAIVMPRLHHGSLSRLVAIRGHLTPGEVITVLTPVALTLAQLHDEAVVHGDLSAANIGFDDLGRPVVLDLGIASVIGTPREVAYGTPGFIAPEVFGGAAATPASDVYAIGALGWFALTGDPPALPADREPLADLLPDVPAPMVEAIERALHPDPAARGDGRELARAVYASGPARPVQPVIGDDPAHMLTHRVRSMARQDEEPSATRRGRREQLRTRSRAAHQRVLASLVAAVVLGVCGVVVAGLDRGEIATPAVDASTPAAPHPTAVAIETSGSVDYEGIVQGLVDARARAWNDADPTDLPAAFAGDSAQLDRDVDLITTAVDAGHRYAGLTFTVDDVTVLTESADRVTLRTTVQTSRYAVHTDTAGVTSVEDRPAQTESIVLTLVRSADGWRIAQVSPDEV